MIGQLVARAGERIAGDLEGRRSAVELALSADLKRRLAPGVIVGGDRTVELQVTALVVEAHVRVVDGYVPRDREVRGPGFLVRIGPLPVGVSCGIAHEIKRSGSQR